MSVSLLRTFSYLTPLLWIMACQSTGPSVTFKAQKDSDQIEASLGAFDKPVSEVTQVGKLPQVFSSDKLAGKVLRLSAPASQSQYWFFPQLSGTQVTAAVKLEPQGGSEDNNKSTMDIRTRNTIMRLVLKSYKALIDKDAALAVELADQVIKIEPQLAGPYLIKGLAYLQDGDRQKAATALTQAKTLDPEDGDIDLLLKETR